jgi:hypothetical protein
VRLQNAFRAVGLTALAAAALYVAGSLYFHAGNDVAYQTLRDSGQVGPNGGPEFVVNLEYPWLTALRIANAAAVVAALCGIACLEWRARKRLKVSPLFCLPALFVYASAAAVNDIIINYDLTELDLSGAGSNEEGHIEIVLIVPMFLLTSAVLFALTFATTPRPVFSRPPLLTAPGLFALAFSALFLWVLTSALFDLACAPGYTNILQPGAYPAAASVIFCAYVCCRIVVGHATAKAPTAGTVN